MIRVGITGGIGSGKSVVSKVFHEMGFPVFNSDLEARKLMESDSEIVNSIIALFGEKAYINGKLDRKHIADKVFSNQELLNQLNLIVHPATRQAFESFAQLNNKHRIVFNEAAVLFETGAYKKFDFVILVTAPEELRIKRVVDRDGVDREQVKQRLSNQWKDEQKIGLADFVLVNDEKQPMLVQIENVLSQLL
jgi:dephospho-CoA kinase